MNITFFIGNGFDINLGLKTRYSDFYPYFIEKATEHNMIKKWINENEVDWSNLEEKLGQELENVSECDLEQFYNDKDELDYLLLDYLELEQEKYCFDNETIIKEFSRSMSDFYLELPDDDVHSIRVIMDTYRNEEFIYRYIVFNYTNILDKIVALYKDDNTKVISKHKSAIGNLISNRIGDIIHIHGTTDGEMILGVNDETQINNNFLKNNNMFRDTFIKNKMNIGIGQGKTRKTMKIINDSHIICVFGMSIGSTDGMWWEELINWLIADKNNRLIIYRKSQDNKPKKSSGATIRDKEKVRREIFEKGRGNFDEKIYDSIRDRIMVVFNSYIFNFHKV
jgi:hypothetical protein